MRKPNREVGTGRYTYHGGLDRMCVCGHSLGAHSAVRLRDEATGKMVQDCMAGTAPDGDAEMSGPHCNCQLFRISRRKSSSPSKSAGT